MKRFLLVSCLTLCGCVMQPAAQQTPYGAQPVYDYNNPQMTYNAAYPAPQYAAPVVVDTTVQNPYAFEPPAYEDNTIALQRKEKEVFEKEKALLSAQQELYDREKTLANREADFYNRSKALSYKEQTLKDQVMGARPSYMDEPRAYATNIYLPPAPTPYAAPVAGSVPMGQPNPASYSTPADYTVQTASFVIMQHPIQRDLVRCPVTDDVCLTSYERLGYVRSNNLSRFTAEEETISEAAYPAGKWRNDNTIPRW